MGNVQMINRLLERYGRKERLRIGKGYVYMTGGNADNWKEQGIHGTNFRAITINQAVRMVEVKFEENGERIQLAFTGPVRAQPKVSIGAAVEACHETLDDAIKVVRQNLRDAKKVAKSGEMTWGTYDYLKDFADGVVKELNALK